MNPARRTQPERSANTRAALISAARALFGARGFSAVGTTEIVEAASLTRGALYHQFPDKTELFAAVYEQLEQELVARIAQAISDAGAGDPLAALQAGVEIWFDVLDEPEIQRVVLMDAPSVLGWARCREIAMRHAAGLVEGVVEAAMESGQLTRRPVRPVAHLLIGALDEAALYVSQEPDTTAAARADVTDVLTAMLTGLTATPAKQSRSAKQQPAKATAAIDK